MGGQEAESELMNPSNGPARRVALAVTVGDPGGHFLRGLQHLSGTLDGLFAGVGAVVMRGTDERVASHLRDGLGARIAVEDPTGAAGRHRRRSVELALELQPDAVLYSDVDHVLRWAEAAEPELRRCLELTGDLVVVGRTEAAMEASPRRLRETERIVNHIYRLMTGRDWDLMFAIRLMSAPAAAAVVAGCEEDSIANDVEWPLFLEGRGFSIEYLAAEGLSYRTREDFGAPADRRDQDPAGWIDRVVIANQHASVLARYLDRVSGGGPLGGGGPR
jgi:hypothetical protein